MYIIKNNYVYLNSKYKQKLFFLKKKYYNILKKRDLKNI